MIIDHDPGDEHMEREQLFLSADGALYWRHSDYTLPVRLTLPHGARVTMVSGDVIHYEVP